MFLLGMSINIESDNLMRELKEKAKQKKDSVSKYVIPRGGLYEYVS